jgi:hypothetical protein
MFSPVPGARTGIRGILAGTRGVRVPLRAQLCELSYGGGLVHVGQFLIIVIIMFISPVSSRSLSVAECVTYWPKSTIIFLIWSSNSRILITSADFPSNLA